MYICIGRGELQGGRQHGLRHRRYLQRGESCTSLLYMSVQGTNYREDGSILAGSIGIGVITDDAVRYVPVYYTCLVCIGGELQGGRQHGRGDIGDPYDAR